MSDDSKFQLMRGLVLLAAVSIAAARPAAAQDPPPPPWDVELGASFVGTSGNADTSSTGANLTIHRHWPKWQVESTTTAIRAKENGLRTKERYLTSFRAQRQLASIVGLTSEARVERDLIAGVGFRSILNTGLSWALVQSDRWTLNGISAAAWSHEAQVGGPHLDDPTGLLQLVNHVAIGASGDTTARISYYPNFQHSTAYRAEGELSAQASMNRRLALKLGYLLRYSNAPVPGFLKTDNTATASVVVRWHGARPTPPGEP